MNLKSKKTIEKPKRMIKSITEINAMILMITSANIVIIAAGHHKVEEEMQEIMEIGRIGTPQLVATRATLAVGLEVVAISIDMTVKPQVSTTLRTKSTNRRDTRLTIIQVITEGKTTIVGHLRGTVTTTKSIHLGKKDQAYLEKTK